MDRDALFRAIRGNDVTGQWSKDAIASTAFAIATIGFGRLVLHPSIIKKKTVHRVRSTPHLVVLRRLNYVISRSANLKSADRDVVVQQLAAILSEGVTHRVYKFDVKSFFESVDTAELSVSILADNRIPRSASLLLNNYFERLKALGIQGIPRGIPLSATLAEYAMQDFDMAVSSQPEVYFYARYVDDIIIVTGARESEKRFKQKVSRSLPYSLTFNLAKGKCINFPARRPSGAARAIGTFDYLGYNFQVNDTVNASGRTSRVVELSIAAKKLSRIKSRVCLSLASHIASPDFPKLCRRLQLITGNYRVRDFNTAQTRNVGIYCNYRHITSKEGLRELDSFLKSVLVGSRSRLSERLAQAVPISDRRDLLRFSFFNNFSNRTFFHFSPNEIRSLSTCWRNE